MGKLLTTIWQRLISFVGPAGALDDHDIEICPKCDWVGRRRNLTDDGACPNCKLVLPGSVVRWSNAREPHLRISSHRGVLYSARLDRILAMDTLGAAGIVASYPIEVTIFERSRGRDHVVFHGVYLQDDFPSWGKS